MAITILQSPLQYEPAYQNTIPFVVQSDLATESNFRYIFETYTGDTWATVNNFQSFNSAYPRFSDECIYSPHLILQSVTGYTLDPYIDDFTPCTQSFQFYRIDFGEQYNPNAYFINTFPYLASTPDELFLIFDGTQSATTFQVGDQIRIDKTDKSINPQYDGYTTIEGVFPVTFGTQSYTFVWVDTEYGVAPTFGTFSFPETGYVTDLLRIATSSSTYSVFNGVRQYDEIDFDFEEEYGIDIDWTLVNQNPYFDTNSDWTISTFSCDVTISGGVLNYFDTTGAGIAVISQDGILQPGSQYRVTIKTNNNNFVGGLAGDENDTYPIFGSFDNGVFTITFTATGTDFDLELSSVGGVTQGVDIDYIIVEGLYVTQNRFLSVYPENTPKPTYLTNYETLSFFVDPEYPDFSYLGLPRIAYRAQLFDPSGNLVNDVTRYMEDYNDFSFGTPRFDIPVGPAIDSQNSFFTQSINCDGWSYNIWLEGNNYEQHMLNPTFSSSTASWIIDTFSGNATASFGSGLFEVTQDVEFDYGSVSLQQSDVFTPGLTYALVFEVVNSNNMDVYIGDSDNQEGPYVLEGPYENPFVVYPFVPTSTTFSMDFISNDFDSYGIQITNISALTVATGSRISEIKEYDIICQCREYDLVQLAFVNKLGGVDYWTFNLVSKYRSEIVRDRIKKTLPYNYNVGNRQHQIINQKITENWTINTDWITDDQAVFIRELIESPEVYWVKNGKIYPIIIMDDAYDFKSSLNDMQVQYTINFALAYDILSNV